MLYSKEDFVKIVFRLYGYLQTTVKNQPRTLKPNNISHEKTLSKFYELLPENAGVDFLWDFLVFQFYVYQGQKHERKPNPNWFMGQEAFRRWYEYEGGARFYAKTWAAEKGLKNPLKKGEYRPVSEDSLKAERRRMSRISGANFCMMKYGNNCCDPESDICFDCPYLDDCLVIMKLNLNRQLGGTNVRVFEK